MNPSTSCAASVAPQQFLEGWTPEQIVAWQNGWNTSLRRSTTTFLMTQLSQQMQGMQVSSGLGTTRQQQPTGGDHMQQWHDFYTTRGFYPPQNNLQLQAQTQPLPPPAQPSPQ
ncbi:hypothetical protein AX16_009289 [Volvariella volvacea WC 439]|nr:hypothetical protein AX16_009289 [Volvariella volvacea WC 439]